MKRDHLAELLIIKGGLKVEDTGTIVGREHYTAITSISALFRKSKLDTGLHYCRKCYCSYEDKEYLEKAHYPLCMHGKNVLARIPERGKNVHKFRDFCMQVLEPLIIIADFETYTNELHEIHPYSFGMLTHSIHDELKKPNNFTNCTGKNCLDNCFTHSKYLLRK